MKSGYRYRLLSLAFTLCGVLILMLDHLNIAMPLFHIDPAVIASAIVIVGSFLIIADHGKNDRALKDIVKKLHLVMDFKTKTMKAHPEITADELENRLVNFAENINFKEFKSFLYAKNKPSSANDQNIEKEAA